MSAALATIGHNHPPELTPFDQSKAEIEGLYLEAKNWIDGSGVTTETEAEQVSKLIDMTRKAMKTADERRVAENVQFDAGKAEVQARYAPLIADTKSTKGKAVLAIEAAKQALAPYLQRKQDEIDAAAAEARRIADEKAAAAVEAIRASRQGDPDLDAREAAEALLTEAKRAETAAKRVEGTKAHATGGTRAIGLRAVTVATLDDANAFAKWVWTNRNKDLVDFLSGLAKREVAAGHRSLPGVTVTEEKVL
jgi:hypothetical protein